jgi:hypothetical protein
MVFVQENTEQTTVSAGIFETEENVCFVICLTKANLQQPGKT